MTTPARIASQAGDLIRQFNHETISTDEDWQYPSHSYDAIGSLAHLARMLPQAVEQSVRPVRHTYEHGRLTIDGRGDVDQAMQHLRTALDTAMQAAELLAKAVDHLHTVTSPMGLDMRGLPEFND